MKLSPLQYLKKELNFKSKDWVALSDTDKEDLKRWAREEMEVLGVPLLHPAK